MSPAPDPAAESNNDSEESPVIPESVSPLRRWPGLDRLGTTQALGGFAVGLIALLSSYDHITFSGRTIPLAQQWGILFIAASVATVFIDSQLATRARDRAAHESIEARFREDQERYRADRERDLAGQERDRADQERLRADRERNLASEERNRAAQARERQRTSFARLDRSALLCARVQLDPSESNRARLRAFLALIGGPMPSEGESL